MTYTELAARLHITEVKVRRYATAWIQSEGYDDRGREHETLESYIRAVRGDAQRAAILGDGTPWQKGDNNPD